MTTNNRTVPVKTTRFSEETLSKLIEQQARESEVRKQEIDLRLQELKHNSAHAEKILGAQERDRNAERAFELKKETRKLIFTGFCIFMIVILVLLGMYMGKDVFVSDLLKILGVGIAGVLGGYGYSKVELIRNKQRQDNT
jgi:hypothetical protein